MRWHLVYFDDEALGQAWREYFGKQPDVEIIHGDICKVECDAIVSPANSFGFMDGGLDYALSVRFGWDLQIRLQEMIRARPAGELLVGEALVVPTNDADVPWLISAPTMRVPLDVARTVNAYLAMMAILIAALGHRGKPSIETVAVPGLGTGVGALPPDLAAIQMRTAYDEIVLGKGKYPDDLAEAMSHHARLNPQSLERYS